MTPLVFSISLLAAFTVAGLVWYGWGIAENIHVIRESKKPVDVEEDDGDAED